MSEKKVPELRFKGFTGDWEQRKLGDGTDYVKGFAFKSKDYRKSGVRIIRVSDLARDKIKHLNNNIFISMDLAELNKKYRINKNEIIITTVGSKAEMKESAVGRPIIVNENGHFLLNQNLVKITVLQGYDNYFIYSQLLQPRYTDYIAIIERGNANQANIAINDLWEYRFLAPKEVEQQQIGAFFKTLDNTIALHQEKLEKLKQLKKGYLQVMFPKTGEKNPQLRFANFSSNWEQRMLDELVTQVIREVPKPSQPYKRVSVRSHAKGTFQQKVDDPKKVAMDKLFVVKENDLIVNITFAWEHAIAIASKSDNGLLVSHRFPTYRADGKSNINFLRYLISMENFRKKLEFISPGGAGRNRVLNKKDFLKLKVSIPMDIEEQQIIGQFFKRFDDAIILQHNRVEKLKKLKQVYLKLLFI